MTALSMNMNITSSKIHLAFPFNKPSNKEENPHVQRDRLMFILQHESICQEERHIKTQQDIVSLCSPSIQQCERQMYFY